MDSNIIISNSSPSTVHINIEGAIGARADKKDGGVSSYQGFKQALEQIEGVAEKSIVVDIRSTGGDVNDALLIHDALVATGAEVITRCYGYVASAATIIAQAASQGLREISENGLYLIHNAVSQAEGNAQTISQTAELLDKTDQTIAGIYAARSGRGVEEFVALMAENGGSGRWLTPQEALEFGLVDTIIEKTTAVETVVNYSKEKVGALWNKLVKALGVESEQVFKTEAVEAFGAVGAVGAVEASKKEVLEARSKEEQATLQGQDEGQTELEVISREEYENLKKEQADMVEEVDPSEVELSEVEAEIEAELFEESLFESEEEAVEVEPIFLTSSALEARAAATQSITLEVEDPTMEDIKTKNNATAYYEDLKNF